MNNFHTFLSDRPDPFNDEEDINVLVQQLKELISFWLKRYIRVARPWYSFSRVSRTIKVLSVTDENLRFTIKNPCTWLEEYFEFWVDFIETLQNETKSKINDIFYDRNSIKEKTLPVIQSWLPGLDPKKIVDVVSIYSNTVVYNARKQEEYNCLKISFFWDNNTIQVIEIPDIFKGEYMGMIDGSLYKIYMDRQDILRFIVGKNNLLNE